VAVINVSHGLILEGNAMAEINIRKGMPSVQLDKAEFKKRFLTQFYDPAFQPLQKETRQHRLCCMGRRRQPPQGATHL
jgi:hypothetical protein